MGGGDERGVCLAFGIAMTTAAAAEVSTAANLLAPSCMRCCFVEMRNSVMRLRMEGGQVVERAAAAAAAAAGHARQLQSVRPPARSPAAEDRQLSSSSREQCQWGQIRRERRERKADSVAGPSCGDPALQSCGHAWLIHSFMTNLTSPPPPPPFDSDFCSPLLTFPLFSAAVEAEATANGSMRTVLKHLPTAWRFKRGTSLRSKADTSSCVASAGTRTGSMLLCET